MSGWKSYCLAFSISLGSALVNAETFEIEVCQFIGTNFDSKGNTVPPGLDEPLNCDHKCFYDELGIELLTEVRPNLHDMYSIGWRLIQTEETLYDGKVVWSLYLERRDDGNKNSCDEVYAPKRPLSKKQLEK